MWQGDHAATGVHVGLHGQEKSVHGRSRRLYSRSMEWMPQRYREHREICPQKGQIYHRYQSGFPWCHAGIRQKSHSWIKRCENRKYTYDSEWEATEQELFERRSSSSAVLYEDTIVMLVAAIIVPFGLEGLAVNAGLATRANLRNLWINRLRRSAGLLPQLIGLKILKYTKYSCDFQTSIWNKIPRWPLLRFNQRFPN